MSGSAGVSDRFARAPLAVKLVGLIAVLTTMIVGGTFWALSLDLRHETRDFFGAHTYRRTDREGSFPPLFSYSRSEVSR